MPRTRLLELLDKAVAGPLTLVSAPAGWGKTALLAAWARSGRAPGPVAWLSVESWHSVRFWDHVAATVGGVEEFAVEAFTTDKLATENLTADKLATENLTADKLATGSAPRPSDVAVPDALADVIQALRRPGPPIVLILDDLHELTGPEIWGELETLLSTAGDRLRLVIACRTDPALTLYRFRMRGALTELRNGQLGFTLAETAQLLTAHGVRLAESTLVDLHSVIKGWAAGLRLAALAVQGHPEPDSLVPRFALQDRALGEYLVGEVFEKLPEEVREVLLCTSVLDQVSAELVEALTGRTDGARVLASLEAASLFVVHGNAGWYGCHPLFGLMLYEELRHRRPEQVRHLHRRASAWYTAHDLPADALRHALAAREWDRAADVVNTRWHELVPGARLRTFKEMVPPPPQEVRDDPRLALAFAAERLDANDPQATGTFLQLVDRSQHTLVEAARDELRPILAAFRVAEARLAGDSDVVLRTAPLLLDGDTEPTDTRPDDPDRQRIRALVLVALGGARMQQGDLTGAESALLDGLALSRRTGLVQSQVACLRQLAELFAARGRLTGAIRFGREALELADRSGMTQGSDVVWTELTVADVCHQQARIRAAEHYLERAVDGGGLGDPGLVASAAIVRARVRAATGEARSACAELAVVRRELVDCRIAPYLMQAVALVEAELQLTVGELAAVKRLLAGEVPELYAAWVAVLRGKTHLAERRPAAALSTVQPYLEPGRSSLRWTVEANLTHARALRALGDRNKAGRSVERALHVADEEQIRWPFFNGGQPVRELLTSYLPAGTGYRGLAEDLAGEIGVYVQRPEGAAGELTEPLTERELAVLRYLQGSLSAGEIAGMLYVSVNTVKTHMKNIYRKLGAGRRREVIERARELNLL